MCQYFIGLKWVNYYSKLVTHLISICFEGKSFRSIRSQMFFKIGVLKTSQYSQESTCVEVSFKRLRVTSLTFNVLLPLFSSLRFSLQRFWASWQKLISIFSLIAALTTCD